MGDQANNQTLILPKSEHEVQPPSRRWAIRREAAADLARLAIYLPRDEGTLITWIYAEGRTRAELAALLKVSRRRLGERVERIVRRMRTPEFALAALHVEHWTGEMRTVAVRCVLGGESSAKVAREMGVSVHAVRRRRAEIAAMAHGARLAAGETQPLERSAPWRGTTQNGHAARWRRSA